MHNFLNYFDSLIEIIGFRQNTNNKPVTNPMLKSSKPKEEPTNDKKVIQKHKLVVDGYIREDETLPWIPITIIDLIVSFFGPLFYIWSYNKNDNNNKWATIASNIVQLKKLYHNNKTNFIVTTDDILFEKQTHWKNFKQSNFFKHKNKKPKIVSEGVSNSHAFIYTINKKLYGFGSNSFKQIINSGKDEISSPSLIKFQPMSKFLISIQCGTYHSLFLTFDGFVYSCGGNQYGQCGIKRTNCSSKTVCHDIIFLFKKFFFKKFF